MTFTIDKKTKVELNKIVSLTEITFIKKKSYKDYESIYVKNNDYDEDGIYQNQYGTHYFYFKKNS